MPLKPVDFGQVKAAVDGGITGLWMPPVTSAWSIFRLGGRGIWFDPQGRVDQPVPPQAWDEARKTGIYVLDDHGKFLPAIRDTVRLCADHDVTLSFGHLSLRRWRPWPTALARLGYRRAFIDHPFSEVFELDVPTMKRWADAGVRFARTWDELSPLLGVDPQDMWRPSGRSGRSTSCCRAMPAFRCRRTPSRPTACWRRRSAATA